MISPKVDLDDAHVFSEQEGLHTLIIQFDGNELDFCKGSSFNTSLRRAFENNGSKIEATQLGCRLQGQATSCKGCAPTGILSRQQHFH
jgi:hypothetical protein